MFIHFVTILYHVFIQLDIIIIIFFQTPPPDGDDYAEEFPDVLGALRRHATCSLDTVKNRLPILDWLPKYKREDLLADFVAGLTVGLTAIPQGIAYAVVAGLEPQYGLYSGFMGCFVYLVFGSCKDITIGEYRAFAYIFGSLLSGSG